MISAGFAERCGVDDRRDLQGELGEFARTSGMRISGPNCLGLANVKHDIWATASSRGAEGLTGPIGLVCQSGATAFGPFLVRAVENGIGFRNYIISTGSRPISTLPICPLPAGRSGYAGHCRLCRGLQAGRQVSRSGKARGRTRQTDRPHQDRAFGARRASGKLAYRGADGHGCPVRCYLRPIWGDRVQDYDELIEVAHLLATPQARRARPRRGVALGRH